MMIIYYTISALGVFLFLFWFICLVIEKIIFEHKIKYGTKNDKYPLGKYSNTMMDISIFVICLSIILLCISVILRPFLPVRFFSLAVFIPALLAWAVLLAYLTPTLKQHIAELTLDKHS